MKHSNPTCDTYMPDPGQVDTCNCGICGTPMDVQRNVDGPTNFMMAQGGSRKLHDFFSCPLREEEWHQMVVALREEARRLTSPSLKAIVLRDADHVLVKARTDGILKS